MQKLCKKFHSISHLFYCIRLRSCLDQKCLRFEMHVIAVCPKENVSGKSRIIFGCCNLHLKGKCQIVFQIWIRKITDISICPRSAESVEEHDLRRLSAIHLCHKMCPFRHTVPVQIQHNLGSDIILDGITPDGEISDAARAQVNELLKRSFRPEFLNRLDEIIFYKPLTRDNVREIVGLKLKEMSDRLKEKRVHVVVTDAAVERIIEQSFDPAYGARPINRFIQSHIETLIARKLIAEDVAPDSTITVGLDADGAFTASVSAIVPAEEQNG